MNGPLRMSLPAAALILGTLLLLANACNDATQVVAPSPDAAAAQVSASARSSMRLGGDSTGIQSMPIVVDWYSCSQTFSGDLYNCQYSGSDYYDTDHWVGGSFFTTEPCELTGSAYCDQTLRSGPLYGPYGSEASNETFPDAIPPLETAPNCQAPRNAGEKAFCDAVVPSQLQRARIEAALNDMDAIGGVCSTLAQAGRTLLNNGELRIFSGYNVRTFGGLAPTGGINAGTLNHWTIVSDYWTNAAYNASTTTTAAKDQWAPRNLQQVLAHELDHYALGNLEIPTDPSKTPNSQTCSRLP